MKFGCSFGIFIDSADLICRSTDISKYFSGSLRLRDNESRLYMTWISRMTCILGLQKLVKIPGKVRTTKQPNQDVENRRGKRKPQNGIDLFNNSQAKSKNRGIKKTCIKRQNQKRSEPQSNQRQTPKKKKKKKEGGTQITKWNRIFHYCIKKQCRTLLIGEKPCINKKKLRAVDTRPSNFQCDRPTFFSAMHPLSVIV